MYDKGYHRGYYKGHKGEYKERNDKSRGRDRVGYLRYQREYYVRVLKRRRGYGKHGKHGKHGEMA